MTQVFLISTANHGMSSLTFSGTGLQIANTGVTLFFSASRAAAGTGKEPQGST